MEKQPTKFMQHLSFFKRYSGAWNVCLKDIVVLGTFESINISRTANKISAASPFFFKDIVVFGTFEIINISRTANKISAASPPFF